MISVNPENVSGPWRRVWDIDGVGPGDVSRSRVANPVKPIKEEEEGWYLCM